MPPDPPSSAAAGEYFFEIALIVCRSSSESDGLAVLTYELAHATSESSGTPARVPADARRKSLASHSADSR